jgi:hypothetical protein
MVRLTGGATALSRSRDHAFRPRPPILLEQDWGGTQPALRLMRIDLSAAPHRVTDLLRFLRNLGYVAEEVEYAVVQVRAP